MKERISESGWFGWLVCSVEKCTWYVGSLRLILLSDFSMWKWVSVLECMCCVFFVWWKKKCGCVHVCNSMTENAAKSEKKTQWIKKCLVQKQRHVWKWRVNQNLPATCSVAFLLRAIPQSFSASHQYTPASLSRRECTTYIWRAAHMHDQWKRKREKTRKTGKAPR